MPFEERRHFLKGVGAAALLPSVAAGRPVAPIKIGQIGVGHAHATKLSVYRASPEYEVVGIVEPDENLRKKAEGQPAFKDLKWMTREQLLNAPGLQAVLVETRVADLLDNADACVKAGKHVHLDKPAGDSLVKYREILNAAGKQKLLVQMGYMYRYNPAVVLLRDMLKKGWLGEPFEIHTVMSKVLGAGERKELAQFSGGILFELGGHIIDLVVGLLGKPTAAAAYGRQVAAADDKLRDNMLAVFEYPKALATVKSAGVEVDGGARRHLALCGTEGTFHIQPLDNPSARVALSKPREGYKKGYQEITFPKFNRYVADAADMARILRGEKEADFPYSHDLAVQETLLKACGMPTT